jgi:hypothetical protein
MPFMIVGTIVISLGAWSVVIFPGAHIIIYVGSVGVLLAGLFLVILRLWQNHPRPACKSRASAKPTSGSGKGPAARPAALWRLWQMVFMNFVVSGIGIFMAAKLTEIIRVWPAREERITLTGHWHILSGIIATILLLYFADMMGLKGRARRWFGWLIIIGSDLAFASATIFSLKRLFVSELAQQPLVDTVMLLVEIGLGTVLVVLAAFMLWRLFDLFAPRGHWRQELHQDGLGAALRPHGGGAPDPVILTQEK